MDESPKRLLVVDDDMVDRTSVIRLLGSRYTINEAKNGAEAIEASQTLRPDCVLVDYRLPDMDGVDLVRQLAPSRVAMVMLTGGGDERVAVDAMKAGAYDYVTKNQLDADRLNAAIARAFDRSRLERRLEETRQELEDFVAITSHDLRSPLTTIVGYLQIVSQVAEGVLPEQERQFVDRSRDLADGLIDMIDQLIQHTKTGRSNARFEAIDLREAAQIAVERLRDAIENSQGAVKVEDLPAVNGVQEDLVQLLQNLIANALKFHGDAPPRIRVFADSVSDQELVVSVEDNGIGIDAAHREEIFAPLKRVHGDAEFEGHGLGLATCRKIVQQHGGRIWVEPAPAGGSIFRFTIAQSE